MKRVDEADDPDVCVFFLFLMFFFGKLFHDALFVGLFVSLFVCLLVFRCYLAFVSLKPSEEAPKAGICANCEGLSRSSIYWYS